MQVHTYEHAIFAHQLRKAPAHRQDLGIFDCDDFDLFSLGKAKVGWHRRTGWVRTRGFKYARVGRSSDHTAGNSLLFMHMWNAVKHRGKYEDHDFTIKVDPDCVLIPDRLRSHLKPIAGDNLFIANCNDYPKSPLFPLMYGALEVFSRSAMRRYYESHHACFNLNWGQWGEDRYMDKCLRVLGVTKHHDFGFIGDRLCHSFHGCDQDDQVAFHPFKSTQHWMHCWNQAMR